MATTFEVGDVVVARVTAQGMTKGESYLVVDAITAPTIVPGGSFVTYVLQRGDDRFSVVNLHVLAEDLRTLYVKARAKRVQLAAQLKKQPRNAALKAKLREAEGIEDRREWAWHKAMHASNPHLIAVKTARS